MKPFTIPSRGQWAFEVKWNGFRALISTRPYRIRSRRRWDMTPHVGFLAELASAGDHWRRLGFCAISTPSTTASRRRAVSMTAT